MRKIAAIILACVCSHAYGQTVSSVGLTANLAEQKIVTETTAITDNGTGYAYNEINTKGSWYGQFFVEQKWWEVPVFVHAEYRGVMDGTWYQSAAFLGAAWCSYWEHGFIAVEPFALWRQYEGAGAQLSVVGGWEWRWFELQHYTDVWKTHKMGDIPVAMYNEARAWFKAARNVSIGAVGTMYWAVPQTPGIAGYLAIKYKF